MAFHSYQPLLAAAGMDSVCSVYAIDNHPSSGALASGGGGRGVVSPFYTASASTAPGSVSGGM